jgi:hypothetical protein
MFAHLDEVLSGRAVALRRTGIPGQTFVVATRTVDRL